MKENREVTDINVGDIEEVLKKFSTSKRIKMYELLRIFKREGIENFVTTRKKYIDVILSDYKRVLEENEKVKKDYYNVINKIENKIDRFDYKFEKAKRQNNKDKSDCYWNLIINFKELLESEE